MQQPQCADQPTLVPKISELDGQSTPGRRQAVVAALSQLVSINWVVRDRDGNPVDLTTCGFGTGVSSIGYSMLARFAEAIIRDPNPVDSVVTVIDAENGLVQINVNPMVTASAAVYIGELGIFDATNNLVFSNSFYLIVERGLFGGIGSAPTGPPAVAEIRLHLRDSCAEDNYLLDHIEFDLAEVAESIIRAVDYWNSAPPPLETRLNTSNFPFTDRWEQAIIAYLMRISAANYRRNWLPYQAAGIAVDDKKKFEIYEQEAARRWKEYTEWVTYHKVGINMSTGFGSVVSYYSNF
jgi:hypothetical protein